MNFFQFFFFFTFSEASWLHSRLTKGQQRSTAVTETIIDFILTENLIKSDGNEKVLMGMLMNKMDVWNNPSLMIPFLYRNNDQISLSSLYLLSTVMQKG